MIKKFLKAFTMAELIMSLFVMALVSAGAISIVFKKSKTPKKIVADVNNEIVCSTKANNCKGGCICKNNLCTFELTPDMISKEFFEITLIGGGAGFKGSNPGGKGEEVKVYYPSLVMPFGYGNSNPPEKCNSPSCKTCGSNGSCLTCVQGYKKTSSGCERNFAYHVMLGAGGDGNGGQTTFWVEDKGNSSNNIVLEVAAGGLSNNGIDNGDSSAQITSSDNGAGNGGTADSHKGKAGEFIIRW